MRESNQKGERVEAGRPAQRRRTRRALLDAAARLIAAGQTPSVTEVASAADVSRRTAYRYFPTQEQLLTESALEALRPEVEAAVMAAMPRLRDELTDVEAAAARLDAVVRTLHRLSLEHEALLRTMMRVTSTSPRSGRPLRGYRRVEWLEMAISPLRENLGSRGFADLLSALAMTVGADSAFVLRDIRGLSAGAAERVVRWAARALLTASVTEAKEA